MTPQKYMLLGVAMASIVFLMTNAMQPDSITSKDTDEREPTVRKPHDTTIPNTPTEATFCGERVPLERVDIYESLDREIIANTFLHSNTILILKRTGRYFPMIEKTLKEMGVPDDMKYLCAAESNLVPTIKSPVGAAGLWQFMEGTAKEYGLKVTDEIDERYDPEKSTRAACRKLLHDYEVLGSWSMVAAAYNGGMARVSKNKESQKQDSYYDIRWAEETSRYVFRIVALKSILGAPAQYGFTIEEGEKYEPYATRDVDVAMPMGDVAQWAVAHGTSYKMLRTLNPWICKQTIMNARGTMRIRLPKE